jgi:CRISPR/Cas system-associated protein Cas10 (large subunit of type III CRISPR-Cas system)
LNQCSRCKKLRNKKDLNYDPNTLKTVCEACREKGAELVPFSIDSLVSILPNNESTQAILKTLGKTAAFRPTPLQSKHLALIAQERGFTNIHEILSHVLDYYMQTVQLDAELTDNMFSFSHRTGKIKPVELTEEEKKAAEEAKLFTLVDEDDKETEVFEIVEESEEESEDEDEIFTI